MTAVFVGGCQSKSSLDIPKEIILNVGDGFEVTQTKTEQLTSIPSSLYWGGTTGGNAAGTSDESAKWSCESKAVSSNTISTGKYQTYSATTYNYYVSNASFSVGTSTTMTISNNNTDIVCGRTAQSTSTTPSVTLNHIFARTGSLTLNTQSGYTLSGVSWSLTGKSAINGTAGTYNLRTGSWTSTSATLGTTSISSSSNLYLIPGTYTISVTYTLTKGDWSHEFTKSGDITLVGGKVNNVTATAIGGNASEIVISVSLNAWGAESHTPTFS